MSVIKKNWLLIHASFHHKSNPSVIQRGFVPVCDAPSTSLKLVGCLNRLSKKYFMTYFFLVLIKSFRVRVRYCTCSK